MSSIRSLLSTTASSAETLVIGAVNSGKIIGNATEWAIRQSERWNSDNVKLAEQFETSIWNDLFEATADFTGDKKEDLSVDDVKQVAKELNACNASDVLNELDEIDECEDKFIRALLKDVIGLKSLVKNLEKEISQLSCKIDDIACVEQKNTGSLSAPTMIENILQNYGVSGIHHMTHIDNLANILKYGLLSHNRAVECIGKYSDISNQGVNARREKRLDCLGLSRTVHSYVPFYFNIRNPMLYCVRQEYGDGVVILEYDYHITSLNQYNLCDVLFSNKNASTNDAIFQYDINALNDHSFIEFDDVFNIHNQPFNDTYIKQVSMAEILVYGQVGNEYLRKVHVSSQNIYHQVHNILRENNILTVQVVLNENIFDGF